MSIGLKSDSSGTSGSIVINGSDAVLVTPTGITTASIQDSSITTAKIADGNITFAKLSTSTTEADNVAKRTAKAWVNFDGLNAFSPNPSTTAIRASFNVSSITDGGTGVYTLTFATALSDTNYCYVFGVERDGDGSDGIVGAYSGDSQSKTTAALGIKTGFATSGGNFGIFDAPTLCVSIFR